MFFSSSRYNHCKIDPDNDSKELTAKYKIIKIRVINTLTKWMESHKHHFYKDLVKQVGTFLAGLPESESRKLRKAHQRLVNGSSSNSKQQVKHQKPPPKPILPSSSSFPVTAIDPKELARQVSLVECK